MDRSDPRPSKILLCFDTDPQPSVFDAVVAIDAGADQLLRQGGIAPDAVRALVYGAMFTRGPAELKSTAIFIGGSDVAAGDALLAKTRECFFGPMRVSVMLDSNGANTTAAAAVLSARKHLPLAGQMVTVLAATGSVGRRVVRLMAGEGAVVRAASRKLERARQVCDDVRRVLPHAQLVACEAHDEASVHSALTDAAVVIAAGAPGVVLVSEHVRSRCHTLKVAIDLNAVPPTGIAGIEPGDKAVERGGQVCYGAIGVGSLKMKLHKAAIRRLFEANDLVLDAEEIYELGQHLID
ncbi:MAG TPA: NAD(P)-dependent methylenetetrahydromethanopterin dehydrogenase [Lacipirellulaceae bacterium]|nr:NAD(P)-dependent methylenetetrahydromethanopterin dehydrogenase [Lacipirellulaceae bacterium]